MKITIPDITVKSAEATYRHIELAVVRNDIIQTVLEIFLSMAKSGNHIDEILQEYNEPIDTYSVSYFFLQFKERVVISWDSTVSVISIQSFALDQRSPVGNIAIMVKLDKPPQVENLSDTPSTLTCVIFKHLKRHLSQYNPKDVIK